MISSWPDLSEDECKKISAKINSESLQKLEQQEIDAWKKNEFEKADKIAKIILYIKFNR